jgi:hypothetical protein
VAAWSARPGSAGVGLGQRSGGRVLAGWVPEAERGLRGGSAARWGSRRSSAARVIRGPKVWSSGRTAICRPALPGRSFTCPADFNAQLEVWLTRANARQHRGWVAARSTGSPLTEPRCRRCRPFPRGPVGPTRCGCRAITTRLGGNDYSVHPDAVGRLVEARVDLITVTVTLAVVRSPATSAVVPSTKPHRPGAPESDALLRGQQYQRHRAARPGTTSNGGALSDYNDALPGRAGRLMATQTPLLTRALKASTSRPLRPGKRRELGGDVAGRLAGRRTHATCRHAARTPRAPSRPACSPGREFDFDHTRGLKRDLIAHLGTLDFVTAKDNVLLWGRPAPARPPRHRTRDPSCQAGHLSLFATAAYWVTRNARNAVDCKTNYAAWAATRCWRHEVGYILFEPEAAKPFS